MITHVDRILAEQEVREEASTPAAPKMECAYGKAYYDDLHYAVPREFKLVARVVNGYALVLSADGLPITKDYDPDTVHARLKLWNEDHAKRAARASTYKSPATVS